jgi:hypothetical protein
VLLLPTCCFLLRVILVCVQGIDEIEIDFEKRPPTGKSRFTPTPAPKQGKAGSLSAAAAPVSRRSLAARYAAAMAAAAGAAARNTRDTVAGLLRKVSPYGLLAAYSPLGQVLAP